MNGWELADRKMEMESNLMNAYLTAYGMACERIGKSDIEEICINTNARRTSSNGALISVSFLSKDYIVDCTNGEVSFADPGSPVSTTVKVLILHYLLNSKIKPLSGRFISFREIPGGGAIYYQTFNKRAILPLVKTFGGDFGSFYRAAESLSGTREDYGGASVTLKVFPLLPVTYVLWPGDDEFPASGTILFDDTCTSFLPGEDIVLAASFGVYALMEQAISNRFSTL